MIIHTFSVFTLTDVVFSFHFNLHLLKKSLQIRIHHFSKDVNINQYFAKDSIRVIQTRTQGRNTRFYTKKNHADSQAIVF
jgi:hypothetical protein